MLKRISLLLLIVIGNHFAKAQDTHYWTQQYGPRSSLLGGGDAATSRDNSAIINNPGGLGFNDLPNLSITTNAYSMANAKFKDGAGDKLDLKSTQLNIIPLILSGVYKDKKHKRWSVGYALVDKVRYKFDASQRFDGSTNTIDDTYSPGNEEFVSQIDLKNSLSEVWGGITVAYKINDNFAIGISDFGAYREHNFSYNYIARAIVNNGTQGLDATSANFLYNVSYYSVRNIIKLGASGNFGKVNAGISITLPSFNMYSEATLLGDITGANVNLDEETGGTRGSFIANDRQEKLKAKYKSPWSVSGGINVQLNKTRLYVTGEYFGSISPYIYIEPKENDFIRPKGFVVEGSKEFLSVAGGKIPVFNLAIGIEHKLFKEYSLLAGLRNDNSFYSADADMIGNPLTITSANLYHGSLGVLAKRGKSDICVGIMGSYGSNTVEQPANINKPYDNILLMGDVHDTRYRYYSLSFVIGYVHYIK